MCHVSLSVLTFPAQALRSLHIPTRKRTCTPAHAQTHTTSTHSPCHYTYAPVTSLIVFRGPNCPLHPHPRLEALTPQRQQHLPDAAVEPCPSAEFVPCAVYRSSHLCLSACPPPVCLCASPRHAGMRLPTTEKQTKQERKSVGRNHLIEGHLSRP